MRDLPLLASQARGVWEEEEGSSNGRETCAFAPFIYEAGVIEWPHQHKRINAYSGELSCGLSECLWAGGGVRWWHQPGIACITLQWYKPLVQLCTSSGETSSLTMGCCSITLRVGVS